MKNTLTTKQLRSHLRSVILQNDELRDRLEHERKRNEEWILRRISTRRLEIELISRKPEPIREDS
jgi:hypothetical protein